MSLSSHMIARVEEAMANWPSALTTLTEAELRNQREAVRASCGIGVSPAALVLSALEAEIERRRRPGELAL